MDLAAGELRGEVKLGATASFRLGELEVRPATRQLLLRSNSLTVEPRVMQVLVVLGQAGGEVVTRDELIMRCWGGRVVGENAIHRALSRVRELGAGFAEGAFAVETIPKVGYRLSVAALQPSADGAPVHRRVGRILLPVLVIAAAIAATVTVAGFVRKPASAVPLSVRIAPATASVAPDMARELSAGLSGQSANIRIAPASEGSGDLVLTAAPATGGGAVVSLATSGGDFLWSATIPKLDGPSLTPAVAARAGEQLLCVRDLVDGNARVETRTLQLAFAACDRTGEIGSDAQIGPLKAFTADRPQSASGWAYLAIAEACQAKQVRAFDPPHLGRAFRTRAESDIAQAATLQPDNAILFAARAAASEPDWKRSIAIEERGLAVHPQSALLLTIHSLSLQSVGRMGDAIQTARAAVAADPFSLTAEMQLIFVLAHGNFLDQAASELRRADRIWPGSPELHTLRDALVSVTATRAS